MSYDLQFFCKNDRPFDYEAVTKWACASANFKGFENRIIYQNQDTGVYFSLEFSPVVSGEETYPAAPDGYVDTGLSLNLNFLRPMFFGMEAFPVVERLCSDFGLIAFNPQDDVEIRMPDSRELVASWIKHNTWAINGMAKHRENYAPLYLERSKSTYLWEYLSVKKTLQSSRADVFVPNIVVVQHKNGRVLGTATTCTLGIPTMIPECDWVFVAQKKKWFRRGYDLKVLSWSTFRSVLGSLLESFVFDGPQVQLIRLESVQKVGELLSASSAELILGELKRVHSDGFVDVDLEARPVTQ